MNDHVHKLSEVHTLMFRPATQDTNNSPKPNGCQTLCNGRNSPGDSWYCWFCKQTDSPPPDIRNCLTCLQLLKEGLFHIILQTWMCCQSLKVWKGWRCCARIGIGDNGGGGVWMGRCIDSHGFSNICHRRYYTRFSEILLAQSLSYISPHPHTKLASCCVKTEGGKVETAITRSQQRKQ